MPYSIISNFMFRPAGVDRYTHFNITPGKNCIRIEPFSGDIGRLHYLAKTNLNQGIPILKKIRELCNIPKKAYVEVDGDTTYLLGDAFEGNIQDAEYFPLEAFKRIEAPDEGFFEEALSITPVMVRPGFSGSLYIPASLFRAAGITGSSFYIQISLFSDGDARWAEIRPETEEIPLLNMRFSADSYVEALSGISYLVYLGDAAKAPQRSLLFPGWKQDNVCAWYSETRKAIILEKGLEECKACGAKIRSIEREQHIAKACLSCLDALQNKTSNIK